MKNIKNITRIINSINQYKIDKVKIKTDRTNIIISKAKLSYKHFKEKITINDSNVTNNQIRKNNKVNTAKNIIIHDKDSDTRQSSSLYSTIISPMVGTFYKSPAPNENAFVEIGDTIKQKQIVCIIEAMKLMNEIESEVQGEMVEILVKDGDIVDCGQALMKVKVK